MPNDTYAAGQSVESLDSSPGAGGYALPALPTPSPDGYVLLAEVGRGGMGTVYRARDVAIGREVALKVLSDHLPSVSNGAARFVEEARITGQLQHPGIPAVHRVGVLPDGRPFLAMKLIKGRTFDELLAARQDLGDDRARSLATFEAIGQAVGYAHAHGVIHRDLKPQNVMVGAFGEVQVMDWGLAKVVGESEVDGKPPGPEIRATRGIDELTRAGSVFGTPAYMPPEQATGAVARIDARSDVFGLGAILCVILTGRPPYSAADGESTRQLAAAGDVAAARARLDASGAEAELIALCNRCLSPDPADRPANAGEVARAVARLRAAADDRGRKAELDQRAADVRAAEDRKRRRVVTAAAWVVAAVLAIGAGVSWWQANRAERARVEAVLEANNARTAEGNERAARQDADRERNAAVRQEKAATTTKNFLKSVLMLSSAEGQLSISGQVNPNLTLREALLLAAKLIDGRFKDQPQLEAELQSIIGLALERVGAYTEAEPFARTALQLYERELGPDHLLTLEVVHNLSVVYHHLGRLDQALPLLRRVADGRERALGPEHPITVNAKIQLGFQLTCEGKFAEAEPLLLRCREATERVVGRDQFPALFATYSLGLLHHNRERFDLAEPCLKRSAEGFERLLGPDHPQAIESVGLLGHGYLRRKMMGQAGPLLERASQVRDKVLGAKHPDALASAIYLGFYYDESGEHTKADPLWARIHADRAKLPEWAVNTWMPHWAQVRVGRALLAEKKYAEAEPLLRDGYEAMAQKQAGAHALGAAADILVTLNTEWGRPDEAAKWQAERAKYVAREVAPSPRPAK